MSEATVRCPKCGHEGIVITELLNSDLRLIADTLDFENQKLREENAELREGPQLHINVEALVDDVERLSSELDAVRQFVEKHSRTSGHKMDGTAQYRLTGEIGRGKSLWDAINRAENKTEMGDE